MLTKIKNKIKDFFKMVGGGVLQVFKVVLQQVLQKSKAAGKFTTQLDQLDTQKAADLLEAELNKYIDENSPKPREAAQLEEVKQKLDEKRKDLETEGESADKLEKEWKE
jgi:cell division protein FtsB